MTLPLVTLTSADPAGGPVSITVAPGRGAKITSLTGLGAQWLSQTADGELGSSGGSAFTEAEMAGWDECAPSIVADVTDDGVLLSDHGDLWDAAWTLDEATDAIATTAVGRDWPYRIRRSIRPVPGGFAVDYVVDSEATLPRPLLWAAHPQFLAEPGSRVELPGVREVVDFRAPERPLPNLPDLQAVPEGGSAKLWTLREQQATAAILRHPDGRCLRLTWSGEPVRWCGIWIDARRYSRERVIAIEPATGWYDNAAWAQRHGRVLTLQPGERAAWSLTLTFERAGES